MASKKACRFRLSLLSKTVANIMLTGLLVRPTSFLMYSFYHWKLQFWNLHTLQSDVHHRRPELSTAWPELPQG